MRPVWMGRSLPEFGGEAAKYGLDGFAKTVIQPKTADELSDIILDLSRRLEPEWRNRGFQAADFRVRMVLEEALLNAWHHGNHENPDKRIMLTWFFNEDFHLEVQDEGNGFDYTNIPDPTHGENLSLPRGRGVFIIRHFSRDVSWLDGGRRLVVDLSREFDPGC